jgi:hypothetical protein
MIRLLIMTENSRLADALASNLAHETGLDVYRLTQPVSAQVSQVTQQENSILIIVSERNSKRTFSTDNDLLRDYRCFRMITLSPHMHHLYTDDRIERPISVPAQVIDLATDARRES